MAIPDEPVRAAGRAEREQTLVDALADCVVKATQYGTQDGGFAANYILPTGPIHRAIPLLQELGVTVRPGFDGRTAGQTVVAKAMRVDKPPAQLDGQGDLLTGLGVAS